MDTTLAVITERAPKLGLSDTGKQNTISTVRRGTVGTAVFLVQPQNMIQFIITKDAEGL